MSWQAEIKSSFDKADNPIDFLEEIKQFINGLSLLASQPVDRIQWVPIDMVQANDYNPNSVASTEMALLYTSIKHDGYTQPIVTIWDEKLNKFVIVDGFHRYFICKNILNNLTRQYVLLIFINIENRI